MKYSSIVAGALFAAVAMPASAVESIYTAVLTGAAEDPPNTSPANGTATVTIDTGNYTMRVQETFSGLSAASTDSHIHCCTDNPFNGVAPPATTVPTLPNFPSGVMSGTYDHTFNMADASSYSPVFLNAHGNTALTAFSALVEGLNTGTAYANIHSTQYPLGEIRGFLTLVPEPETYAMLLAGLGLVTLLARRRKV